ncbi:MAG: ABC transporter ATP-binding protein, partial [Firmicutes bacterium]|nr:ABC transporter ATP-binding protein [Bacillota bacterium]
DLFEITEFSHHCPEEYLIAALKMIVAFVVLSRYDFLLTLIIFLLVPVMIFCTILFRRRMRKASKKQRVLVGEMNARLEDSLLGTRVVKSFANEDVEEAKFEKSNKAFYDVKNEWYKIFAGFHTTTRFFDGVMYITVVVVGAIFIIKGRITAPDLVAFLLYVSMLLASVRQIVNFYEQFQNGMTGLERFVEIMDTPAEIQDAPDAKPLPPVKGDIRFDHVSFHYNEQGRQVLSGIDITIPAGENVALVGPSGGGKTTIANLVPRFYEATGGRILIDGIDIRTVTMKSLREQIGVVQQDVYLFSGSVRENIEYGKPGASLDEIVEAARKAGADEFIRELPDGYDTYVGERGVKLSGGQKQRISIARVFLKDPPILILDEATSALDNEGEYYVQQSLEKLAVGRTTLTIAHRLTTIRNAKTILVLTRDGIVEAGSHDELMAKDGLYAKMYKMYQL